MLVKVEFSKSAIREEAFYVNFETYFMVPSHVVRQKDYRIGSLSASAKKRESVLLVSMITDHTGSGKAGPCEEAGKLYFAPGFTMLGAQGQVEIKGVSESGCSNLHTNHGAQHSAKNGSQLNTPSPYQISNVKSLSSGLLPATSCDIGVVKLR